MAKKKSVKEAIREEKEKVKSNVKRWGVFVLVGIIVIFLIFVAVYAYQESHFRYLGLDFSKIKMGEVQLYYARIPLMNEAGAIVTYYRLYLRDDPRTLENIPVDSPIRIRNKIIMAADEIKCEDANIAGAFLGDFWGSLFNVGTIIPGTGNKTKAEEKNLEYVDCSGSRIYLDATAVLFKPGETTSISQKSKDCYVITVKNCEIMKASERFVLGLYSTAEGMDLP